MKSNTVVVIGAGAAGLTAARELGASGYHVTILEARARLGGRIFTERQSNRGGPVELGAEFVHGRHPKLWRMAQSAGMLLYESGGEHRYLSSGRLQPEETIWEKVDQVFTRMMQERGSDRSFAEFLRSEFSGRDWHDVLSWAVAYVEGFNAADHERVSVQWLIEDERAAARIEGERQFRTVNGYSRLIDWLAAECVAAGAVIRPSTVVRRVRWRRGGVEVQTDSGESFEADAGVITVPLGVLQSGAITFEPEIESNRAAALELASGPVMRMVFRCNRPFWEDIAPDLGFLHAREEPFPTWWTQYPLQSNLITGWAGGPAAERIAALPEPDRMAAAVDSLAHITGRTRRDLETLLEQVHHHDWQADPFARGAYSWAPTGCADAVARLAAPCDDTLYFAGEATDTNGFMGTVHGAIESGLRAARQIAGST